MQGLWKSIFKKLAKGYIRWYLPLANKIGNGLAQTFMSREAKARVVANTAKIEKATTFNALRALIKGNYEYSSDGIGGFPDWNQDLTTFLGRDWKGDCDAFATNTVKMLKDANLLATYKIVSILPTSFKYMKRMHVVAEVSLKGSPKTSYVLSSGNFRKQSLTDYLKEDFQDVGDYIVVDYYTGAEHV